MSLCLLAPAAAAFAAPPWVITGVVTAPPFFNPSAGQSATIAFEAAHAGRLEVTVLDRDRSPVRRLFIGDVASGPQRFVWDGRDDSGSVVPDEAYALRIALAGAGGEEIYDPSAGFTPLLENPGPSSYSRSDGVLSYTLARPARVHIQAGQARADPKTGRAEGPVLRTVVDRAPRVAGALVEAWNGMDESGAIYVPDLPHFAVAILASSLPANSLITVGNRRQSFAEYVRSRRATARRPVVVSNARRAAHHAGLDALADRSPRLRVVLDGSWDEARRVWTTNPTTSLTAEFAEADGPPFLAQPSKLLVYLDDVLIAQRERPAHPAKLPLDLRRLAPGEHRLVVNWVSDYGPVGVGVTRVVVRGAASEAAK